MAVLKLLASQAAISLENARLYRDLEERETQSDASSTRTSSEYSSGIMGQVIEATRSLSSAFGLQRDD
jgi:GAF domain-containing protein